MTIFGIAGPTLGLLSSSRHAIKLLLRLEALWTAGVGKRCVGPRKLPPVCMCAH